MLGGPVAIYHGVFLLLFGVIVASLEGVIEISIIWLDNDGAKVRRFSVNINCACFAIARDQ